MEPMNYLAVFFKSIANDPRIGITHIGIYAALLQYWQINNYPIPLQVFSHDIMPIAKVSASKTYHKCIRDLSDYGYLEYVPSYNKHTGSKVYLQLN
jgi:hypothetical protein